MTKLCVLMITYNHEEFICGAIDSVFQQEADFDFEFLIGEDDSSDGTSRIVQDYLNRYFDGRYSSIFFGINDRHYASLLEISARKAKLCSFLNYWGTYSTSRESAKTPLQRQWTVLTVLGRLLSRAVGEPFRLFRKRQELPAE